MPGVVGGEKGTRNLKQDFSFWASSALTEAACLGEPRRASKSLVVALGVEAVECFWGLGLGKKSDVDEAVAAREKERTTANLIDRNGGLPTIRYDRVMGSC